MDTVMLVLFVAFMFFIFGGYHNQKFKEREEEEKRLKEKDGDTDTQSPETKAE